MSCFSLAWVEQLLIWCVIIGAIWAIIQLLLPLVIGPLGGAAGLILQILKIVVWAVIVIFIIYIAFDLISCLIGMGGGLSLPHHH